MEVQFGGQVSVKKSPVSWRLAQRLPKLCVLVWLGHYVWYVWHFDALCDILCLRIAYALILPAESTLMQEAKPPIDPTRLHEARNRVRKVIAKELEADIQKRYESLTPKDDEDYVPNLAPHLRLLVAFICFHWILVVSHCMAIASIHLDPTFGAWSGLKSCKALL